MRVSQDPFAAAFLSHIAAKAGYKAVSVRCPAGLLGRGSQRGRRLRDS